VKVEKSPSMPFYGKDIYNDERVLTLSFAHHGLYVRLLWWQWCEGSIAADVRAIAAVVGKERDTRKLWPDLLQFFPQHPELAGRLANPKLEDIRRSLAEFRSKKQGAAHKRWSSKRDAEHDAEGDAKGCAQHDAQGDANRIPAFASAVAFASPEDEETNSPPRSGGSGGLDHRRDRSDWSPVWSQRAFQLRVDKISDFVKTAARVDKIGPGDEDFEVAFQAKWGMSWEYWISQRDAHQAHFGEIAARRSALAEVV
jgi:uncharacterized protein YdaU (DUF1376 family)